jgi:uncharacterized protein YutD
MRNYREILEKRAKKEELIKQQETELELFESYKNIDKDKKFLKRLDDHYRWLVQSFNPEALEIFLRSRENRLYHERIDFLRQYIKKLELLFSKTNTN